MRYVSRSIRLADHLNVPELVELAQTAAPSGPSIPRAQSWPGCAPFSQGSSELRTAMCRTKPLRERRLQTSRVSPSCGGLGEWSDYVARTRALSTRPA